MNAVWRRYFFDEEKPMAFLRHFDVRIPAKERPEKLLGMHVNESACFPCLFPTFYKLQVEASIRELDH
jgi:hypothetical protein